MFKIKLEKGNLIIPKKFGLSQRKRTLKIRMPWKVEIRRLCKDNVTISTQIFLRCKGLGEKPYVPEGQVEIDGIMFEVIDNEQE